MADAADGTWTVDRLMDEARGFRVPMLIAALVKCGALDRLAAGAAEAPALAAACRVDGPALARMLDACASLGIAVKQGRRYALAPSLAGDLAGGGVGTGLDGIRHTAQTLDKWKAIDEVLRQGRADYPPTMDVTADPALNEAFIRAMHAYAGPRARRLAEVLPREGARTLLDLGGGPGTFSLALLAAWPGLEATVADLPLTLRTTRKVIEETGAGDRLRVLEADFYRDRSCLLGGPWDLALVSAVLHAEGEAENRDLLRRVRGAVAPGGRIVIRENLLREDRVGPPLASLFDVHMLVSTRRGRCYTLGEISSMLAEAGFPDPRLLTDIEEGFVVARAEC